MYRNILFFLILLHSGIVCPFLYGFLVCCVDNTTVENFPGTTAMMSVSTESDSTHTSQFSSSTSMDLSTTQIQPNSSLSELSGEPQGLTSGQVVCVAVGSITGVAALGGGIYAGLKYTGKLDHLP